ncbi:coiled-coil domain-containing protein [Klebsiella oxytoca]|uniref:hypothetical protein n=1 Tax=Klebsiella oxytoca TaxID=571 RepID=UPI0012AB3EFB|nr:hypothetical protein [Klebsiella oxytoca]
MKRKVKNITALAFFLLIANENTYAQGNDFIDAIKNLNLQSDDTSITIQQGKSYSQQSNSNINDTPHTQELVKKKLKLQQKYELLLDSYNEMKLSNKYQKLEHQQKLVETLKNEKNDLYNENISLRKQLTEITNQLFVLRDEKENSVTGNLTELVSLREVNTRLKSEVVKAQKQMAEVNTALATLRKDSETTLARKTSELTALGEENSHLETKIEKTEKQLLKITSELEDLKQSNDAANVYKDNALKTAKGKDSYSLGVFYYEKIDAELKKIAHEKINLDPSMMIAGINDAYSKSLKINKNLIMENVVKIDKIVQTINSTYAKQIIKKINKKKYEVLQNSTFLVTEKSSEKKYTNDGIVTFDMLEKTLEGKPVLNTMNTKVRYSQVKDPLLLKIFTEGGKGGVMTLYGKAGDIYKNLPEGIEVENLISITFILK